MFRHEFQPNSMHAQSPRSPLCRALKGVIPSDGGDRQRGAGALQSSLRHSQSLVTKTSPPLLSVAGASEFGPAARQRQSFTPLLCTTSPGLAPQPPVAPLRLLHETCLAFMPLPLKLLTELALSSKWKTLPGAMRWPLRA